MMKCSRTQLMLQCSNTNPITHTHTHLRVVVYPRPWALGNSVCDWQTTSDNSIRSERVMSCKRYADVIGRVEILSVRVYGYVRPLSSVIGRFRRTLMMRRCLAESLCVSWVPSVTCTCVTRTRTRSNTPPKGNEMRMIIHVIFIFLYI